MLHLQLLRRRRASGPRQPDLSTAEPDRKKNADLARRISIYNIRHAEELRSMPNRYPQAPIVILQPYDVALASAAMFLACETSRVE
jgi:hypothetical protein